MNLRVVRDSEESVDSRQKAAIEETAVSAPVVRLLWMMIFRSFSSSENPVLHFLKA